MAELLSNPALWSAVVVAVPATVAGVFGYRRSMRIDAVAEQAGIASTQSASIGHVVEGLDKLVANLQEDNRALREHVKELNVKLDRIIQECRDLKTELARLAQATS